MSDRDAAWMAEALRLAARGAVTTFPNPRVGCVIVRHGEVVGRGWHERAGEAHAEVFALREAGAAARGAEVYVTLEPCAHFGRTPPCADALVAAGVGRVVVAMSDPDPRVSGRGLQRLREAGIVVTEGVLGAQARALNRGFVSRIERGRPFVSLKLAASLDGRTASANGQSQWISSEAARRDVHRLRAEAGAVLVSSATVLADDPALTVRHLPCARQPDRIVLDAGGRVSPQARVWQDDGARRIWLGGRAEQAPAGVATWPIARDAQGRAVLPAALDRLAAHGVNSVLCECGPRLAGALLDADLVDELLIYQAPLLLGDAAPGLVHCPGRPALADAIALDWIDVRQIGTDLRLTAQPRRIA